MLEVFKFLIVIALLKYASATHHENHENHDGDLNDIIDGLYGCDFVNFPHILNLIEINDDIVFQADIAITTNAVMKQCNHTKRPLLSIPLYIAIVERIERSSSQIRPEQLTKLGEIRDSLILDNIVPMASWMLESPIFMHSCGIQNGTSVAHLLDLLHQTNETVLEMTFAALVNNVRFSVDITDLIKRLSNLSKNLQQNINSLLTLHRTHDLHEKEKFFLYEQLHWLKRSKDYSAAVTEERRREVDNIIPVAAKIWFNTNKICLNLPMKNSSRLYINLCDGDVENALCSTSKVTSEELIKKDNGYQFVFNILSENLHLTMSIQPNYPIQESGIKLNVFLNDHNEGKNEFKVNFVGDKVMVSNTNRTIYLCGGNEELMAKHGNLVYTRYKKSMVKHENECKWFIECPQDS